MYLGKTVAASIQNYALYPSKLDVSQGIPAARKVVVVAPSSLVTNWQLEIRKWLGDERLPTLALQPGPQAADQVASIHASSNFTACLPRDMQQYSLQTRH